MYIYIYAYTYIYIYMYIGNHHTQSGMMGYHTRYEKRCILDMKQLA